MQERLIPESQGEGLPPLGLKLETISLSLEPIQTVHLIFDCPEDLDDDELTAKIKGLQAITRGELVPTGITLSRIDDLFYIVDEFLCEGDNGPIINHWFNTENPHLEHKKPWEVFHDDPDAVKEAASQFISSEDYLMDEIRPVE